MAWIYFTLLAVVMQTWRNALQVKLAKEVHISGVTLSRFIFASPIAALYLYVLTLFEPNQLPTFSLEFWCYIILAAVFQIAATLLLILLFKHKNFAVGAGLAKSEALVAGVLGSVFFGSHLSLIGWLGIIIGTASIFVLSGKTADNKFSLKTALIGLLCGSCFALTSLYIREAAHSLSVPFPQSAAWVLLWVILIQTVILLVYILWFQPQVIGELKKHTKLTFLTSFTSCIGSIGWFSAMALQQVAYVKTLGQIEVLLTIVISYMWLKQPVKRNEIIGLILISVAALAVMWA